MGWAKEKCPVSDNNNNNNNNSSIHPPYSPPATQPTQPNQPNTTNPTYQPRHRSVPFPYSTPLHPSINTLSILHLPINQPHQSIIDIDRDRTCAFAFAVRSGLVYIYTGNGPERQVFCSDDLRFGWKDRIDGGKEGLFGNVVL